MPTKDISKGMESKTKSFITCRDCTNLLPIGVGNYHCIFLGHNGSERLRILKWRVDTIWNRDSRDMLDCPFLQLRDME